MRGDGERKKREGERERKSADEEEEAFRVGVVLLYSPLYIPCYI